MTPIALRRRLPWPGVESAPPTRTRIPPMTHVVTEACIRCKYTDCVDVARSTASAKARTSWSIDPDDASTARLHSRMPGTPSFPRKTCPADQQVYIRLNAELVAEVAEHHQAQGPAADDRCRLEGRDRQARPVDPLIRRAAPDRTKTDALVIGAARSACSRPSSSACSACRCGIVDVLPQAGGQCVSCMPTSRSSTSRHPGVHGGELTER